MSPNQSLHLTTEDKTSFRFTNNIRSQRLVPKLIRQMCYLCLYRVHIAVS